MGSITMRVVAAIWIAAWYIYDKTVVDWSDPKLYAGLIIFLIPAILNSTDYLTLMSKVSEITKRAKDPALKSFFLLFLLLPFSGYSAEATTSATTPGAPTGIKVITTTIQVQ